MQRELVVLHPAIVDQAIHLSKTDFTNYRTCAGFAWLARHQPHDVPVETDPGVIRRTNAGDEVELIARDLFPDGVLIDTEDMTEAVVRTGQAIAAGVPTIFQATAWTDRGLLAQADMLTRCGDRWILSEVKATTSIKSEHIADATFQAIAFAEAGFDIAEVRLIHLAREYRRNGEPSTDRLLVSTDITAKVQRRTATINAEIERARAVLQNPEVPGVCLCDMGTRGQRCPTFAHFHPEWPSGNTIYDLGSVNNKTLGEAIARGVVHLADWPDDIDLLPRQRLQIDVLKRGEAHLDPRRVGQLLGNMRFPLHFLDYETFQTAVPLFDGCGPWSQIPFQYSLHVVEADGSTAHREFLWTDCDECPIPALVAQVRRDIGPTGSVIVWNQPFEATRNREMADLVPEAAGFLLDVNNRMIDLMDVVRKGWWVHPDFNGSASIKKILPVVAPELAYDFLEIGDGAQASERWFEAVMGDPLASTERERSDVFAALRIYCRHDTLALVRIWQHLRALVHDPVRQA
ncbi:MAG: DUF2779 domain-containing protein [Chloroflexota bacterium]|nr:DUF2779 domain-containing protein [Chloroflexota bacterium]